MICQGILTNITGDIPGIQKISGFASHSSPSFCFLCQSLRPDLQNLNLESWGKAWSCQEHQDIVLSWKNAETEHEHHQIYRLQILVQWTIKATLLWHYLSQCPGFNAYHVTWFTEGLQWNILGMKGQATSNCLESGSSDSDSGDSEPLDDEDKSVWMKVVAQEQ